MYLKSFCIWVLREGFNYIFLESALNIPYPFTLSSVFSSKNCSFEIFRKLKTPCSNWEENRNSEWAYDSKIKK